MGAIWARRAASAGLAAALGLTAAPAAALEIQDLVSPGGVHYWLVAEPSIPIVALEMRFEGGARLDPDGREGLANLFAGMLEEGAGDLDSVGFSRARDAQSASFGFGANSDVVSVSARMLVETMDPAAALLATALNAPRFDAEALERVRAQVQANIAESGQNPDRVASRKWFADAFPGHPYGRPYDGTAASVAAITRDDLVAARTRLLTRANVQVAVVGAVDAGRAGLLVDTVLGGLPEGTVLPRVMFDRPPPPGLTVIDLPVPQAAAVFGQSGLPLDDPDLPAAQVMSYVLGSGNLASRLMTEVREKRGLAYGVYAYLSNFDEAAFYFGRVQTENARMAETLAVIRAEWARMAAEGITADELDAAKRFLTGSFPMRLDSNAKIAGYLLYMQRAGLGRDYIERHNPEIEAVTLADVKRVAARLLHPDALSIVVAGQPKGL